MYLEKVFENYNNGIIDYDLVLKAKDEFYEEAFDILEMLLDDQAENDVCGFDTFLIYLMCVYEIKEVTPVLLNIFESDSTILDYGDLVSEVYMPAFEIVFDGNYDAVIKTLLNRKCKHLYKGCLLDAFAAICYKNNRLDLLENFIKENYRSNLFDGYADSIIRILLQYRLNNSFNYIKYYGKTRRIDPQYQGYYYEIMNEYWLNIKELDISSNDQIIGLITNRYDNMEGIEVINKPNYTLDKTGSYKYYELLDEKEEMLINKLEKFDYTQKQSPLETLNNIVEDAKLEELYPTDLKEFTDEDIRIDKLCYYFTFIEKVIMYNFEERRDLLYFLGDLINYIENEFNKYLKDNKISHNLYDKNHSIHFLMNIINEYIDLY